MQSRRLAREAIIGLIYELSFHDATEKPEDILADARAARGIPEDEYVDACFLGIADRLPELDEMIRDGNLAISEMKRLNDSIKDAKISADIDRLEDLSAKIFAQVKADPKKLPQIRKFMDYYLPTTLKLLNAYDRMGAQGVNGENIDNTMQRVESMMGTIVTAFEKQLDMLFGSEAMDISTDITVLENMMKREGLSEDDGELHAESGTATASQDDIKLEL